MMIKRALIPASGLGTRFAPYTKVIPKEMLPISNVPAIQLIVSMLVRLGVEEVVIVLNNRKKCIIDYFDNDFEQLDKYVSDFFSVEEVMILKPKISYVFQENPLGLADVLITSKNILGEDPFITILGDVILERGLSHLKQLVKVFLETEKSTIGLKKVDIHRISSVGIINPGNQFNEYIEINDVVEKPLLEKAMSNISIAGSYIFNSNILYELDRNYGDKFNKKEEDLTNVLNILAKKHELVGVEIDGEVFDIGTPRRWFEINQKVYSTEGLWL